MGYKVPKIPPMRELTLGTNSEHTLDGGLCLDEQSSISLTQSPILLNMCLDDGGVPKKRPGQTNLHNNYDAIFNKDSTAMYSQVTSALPPLNASVPYTNIITNGDFSNGTVGWGGNNASISVSSNIITSTLTGSSVNGGVMQLYSGKVEGHIYYVRANALVTNSVCQRINIFTGATIANINNPIINTNYTLSGIFTATSYNYIVINQYYADTATANGKVMQVQQIICVDLTAVFGAGKEPTQAWCDVNLAFTATTGNTPTGWTSITDKSNLNFSTTTLNSRVALLCEMDLTSFCSSYFSGSNSAMETNFYNIVNGIVANSNGVGGTGYDIYVYNYSTSVFELLTTFKSDHISSSNKVDLILYPKYSSDGVIASTMNISSYNFTLSFLKLGYGKINGIYPNYKGKTIVAWCTGIYTQTGTSDMVLIYNSVTNSKAIFYVYNSMLYFFNGYEFLKYDGTTVSTVTPYIPRHSYNCKPDGSNATIDESWNLIGTGFRRAFNGDGTAKDFTLPYQNLDSTAVTAIVDGVNKVEGTDLTVNRATGVVTFTAAPSLSGVLNPNNVEITAYKTFSGYKEQIVNCTRVQEAYSVLFLTGNANLPNQYWVGGLTPSLDASYFPFSRIFTYTGTDKACTCFAVHYGTLLIFKENEFSKIEQVTSPTGISTFNRTNINSEIGCDCPDTMQLINNNPTWLTSYGGVYTLQSSLVPGEKNVIPISININGDSSRPGILQESINDLKSATSFDFNGQYGICLPNGKCYEWEYLRGYAINNPKSMKWYLWDNINASCFFVRDNTLMYGHRLRGQLCKFTDILNDFGSAINAIFSTKLYDFKDPSYEKYVPYCYITTRAGSGSALTVKFIDDQDTTISTELIPVTETKSFNLDDVDLDNWVWDVQVYAPTIALTPILQSIRYLRIEINNNNINEDLSVVAISLPYQFTRRVV